MIKKKKMHGSKNIVHRLFDILDAIGRVRKRNRDFFICANLGFILAVILILSWIMHKNALSSGNHVVEIFSDQGGVNAQVDPSMDALDTGSLTISEQFAASASDTVTASWNGQLVSMSTPTFYPTPSPTPVDFDGFIDFYKLEADHYYNDYGYSSNDYEYTAQELHMLAQVICGEARGESSKGKIAVGNVVMNRVLSRGYPGDTIEAVITASGQFSGYSSSIRPDSACISAARLVLDYEVWVIPQNVYFFHVSRYVGKDWGGHEYCDKIGNHCFYTENYGGRNRNGSVPPALYERAYKWPRYGCEPGARVYRIQYMLYELGYDVEADGYFGKTTEEAVVAFQTNNGLEADGVAGPTTLTALIKTFGENEYCAKFL